MKSFFHAFAATAALSLTSVVTSVVPADAQSVKAQCYERSNLLYALATEHGERLNQTRRVGSNGLLEAFKSPTDGTWTIIYSNDDKLSCVLASGDGLETENDNAKAASELAI